MSSATLAEPTPVRGSAATNRPQQNPGWVVSPGFDLVFLANIYWVILLWPGLLPEGRTALSTEFWAIYFLIAPHRWLTLALVAIDSDRREGRTWIFVGLAVVAALMVGGVWTITGAFTCLAVLDYLWNAWHFASQHQGVLRMYTRKAGGGPDWLERHLLRGFLGYVLIRTAGWTTGWVEGVSGGRGWLDLLDLVAIAVPVAVLGVNLVGMSLTRIGKLCYLVSLLGLYSTLLLALRYDWRVGVIALTAAVSAFHATEYLAVVTHYARRRVDVGSDGAFRFVARQWVGLLAVYAIALGGVGVWLEHPSSGLAELWVGLNLWAAFLHYAFDGLIWKLRRPATAVALGVGA